MKSVPCPKEEARIRAEKAQEQAEIDRKRARARAQAASNQATADGKPLNIRDAPAQPVVAAAAAAKPAPSKPPRLPLDIPVAMDEDLVVKAMHSVFSVRQAFSEQSFNNKRQPMLQEVKTPTGAIYIGGPYGSAFCFHEDGYLVTCEHVRQDTHKQILGKRPAFAVVCPYEGDGAELNWKHSWRAEFVAHTGIEEAQGVQYQNPVLEELAVAGRVLPDSKIDLAILRLVAPVAGTPLDKPPPLPFSTWTPRSRQAWAWRECSARSAAPGCLSVSFVLRASTGARYAAGVAPLRG